MTITARMRKHRWILLIAVLLAGRTPAAEERLLLVADPPLAKSPGADAAEVDWEAGAALEIRGCEEVRDGATAEKWFQVAGEGGSGWLPDAYLSLPPVEFDAAELERIGAGKVDRWQGLPPNYAPTDLVPVGPPYEDGIDYRLRAEAAGALKQMIAAARQDGIRLYVVSGYRPWSKQQELYERKVRKDGRRQDTVAKPGHSEHQLGTAVDLTDGDEEHLLKQSFGETPAGNWLREHAPEFGFAQTYTGENRPRTGYSPEPWHYRYWGMQAAAARHADAFEVTETAERPRPALPAIPER